MKTIENKIKTRVRAEAGDDLGLLVNLLREEKIGYRMLLRNLVEIVNDDYGLTVQAVCVITDRVMQKNTNITQIEFEDTLVALRVAEDFNGKEILIAAISDAMQQDW